MLNHVHEMTWRCREYWIFKSDCSSFSFIIIVVLNSIWGIFSRLKRKENYFWIIFMKWNKIWSCNERSGCGSYNDGIPRESKNKKSVCSHLLFSTFSQAPALPFRFLAAKMVKGYGGHIYKVNTLEKYYIQLLISYI